MTKDLEYINWLLFTAIPLTKGAGGCFISFVRNTIQQKLCRINIPLAPFVRGKSHLKQSKNK